MSDLAIAASTERFVKGTLVLHPATDLLDAKIIVQLIDTTLIDIAGTVISRQEFRVTGLCVSKLHFCVPVPIDLQGRRFGFSAEVRCGRSLMLAPGDYVNTAAVSWHPDRIENITIDVQRFD